MHYTAKQKMHIGLPIHTRFTIVVEKRKKSFMNNSLAHQFELPKNPVLSYSKLTLKIVFVIIRTPS